MQKEITGLQNQKKIHSVTVIPFQFLSSSRFYTLYFIHFPILSVCHEFSHMGGRRAHVASKGQAVPMNLSSAAWFHCTLVRK